MIDLDELHDKMVSYRLVGFTKSDISTIDALELLCRLQQEEKDAARYRWLKGQQWFSCEAEWFMPLNTDADNYEFSLAFDAAIDEALQCNK